MGAAGSLRVRRVGAHALVLRPHPCGRRAGRLRRMLGRRRRCGIGASARRRRNRRAHACRRRRTDRGCGRRAPRRLAVTGAADGARGRGTSPVRSRLASRRRAVVEMAGRCRALRPPAVREHQPGGRPAAPRGCGRGRSRGGGQRIRDCEMRAVRRATGRLLAGRGRAGPATRAALSRRRRCVDLRRLPRAAGARRCA